MNELKKCPSCNGTGKCPYCEGGNSKHTQTHPEPWRVKSATWVDCKVCEGKDICIRCDGLGRIRRKR